MLPLSTVYSGIGIVHVFEDDLYAGVDIRLLRQLELVVWLGCLEQLCILLRLLRDAKSIDLVQKFRNILVLRNKPALHLGVPALYFAPQKAPYGIELSLPVFLGLLDNIFLERVTELDKVGPNKDFHLFLLHSDVCSLDFLHSRYQMLHLLKVYLVLHQNLELLPDDHCDFLSQRIVA